MPKGGWTSPNGRGDSLLDGRNPEYCPRQIGSGWLHDYPRLWVGSPKGEANSYRGRMNLKGRAGTRYGR